jgi:hypothetical protein
MDTEDCIIRIKQILDLMKTYDDLYFSKESSLYLSPMLKDLKRNLNKEYERLEELKYNLELDDSYDQNTGRLHEAYTRYKV